MASSHLPFTINTTSDTVFSPYSPLALIDFISPPTLIVPRSESCTPPNSFPTLDHTQDNGPLLSPEIVAPSPLYLSTSPPTSIHTSPPQQSIPVALDPSISNSNSHSTVTRSKTGSLRLKSYSD